uniref:Uncharacterized protein n=1 Tax=Ditylenchus dipsaci TaxID=166011 RepID=A0A915ET72_9BILA
MTLSVYLAWIFLLLCYLVLVFGTEEQTFPLSPIYYGMIYGRDKTCLKNFTWNALDPKKYPTQQQQLDGRVLGINTKSKTTYLIDNKNALVQMCTLRESTCDREFFLCKKFKDEYYNEKGIYAFGTKGWAQYLLNDGSECEGNMRETIKVSGNMATVDTTCQKDYNKEIWCWHHFPRTTISLIDRMDDKAYECVFLTPRESVTWNLEECTSTGCLYYTKLFFDPLKEGNEKCNVIFRVIDSKTCSVEAPASNNTEDISNCKLDWRKPVDIADEKVEIAEQRKVVEKAAIEHKDFGHNTKGDTVFDANKDAADIPLILTQKDAFIYVVVCVRVNIGCNKRLTLRFARKCAVEINVFKNGCHEAKWYLKNDGIEEIEMLRLESLRKARCEVTIKLESRHLMKCKLLWLPLFCC